MCGVCGVVHLDQGKPVDPGLIERMMEAMVHRGPDDSGSWYDPDGQVGFGHRRLSIVDLSPQGHQPMTNESESVIVTFNGEIYNHLELRKGLEARGHRYRSRSDTESLVHLYEEKGERMVDDLDGDFGFGVWDRDRRRLMLARDRAGVKPLYYALIGRTFVFASEVRAILATRLATFDVDEEALYHYLTYLVSPAPKTLVKDIHKLSIGSFLTLDATTGAMRIERYWEPLPGKAPTGDLDDTLESLFDSAVKKRLMADVPVGVLFSGGVDSTLNAVSFGAEIAPRKVRTFNVGIDGAGWLDESQTAREIAAVIGSEHFETRVGEEELLTNIRDLVTFQDEPISDPVCIPLYFVTRLARETGTIVLHAGEGADEIFCGYSGYTRYLNYHKRLWGPLSMIPRFAARAGGSLASALAPQGTGQKIADIVMRRGKGQELFLSSAVAFYENEKSRILSPDFARATKGIDSFDPVRPLYDRIHEAAPDATFLQRLTYIELNLRLPELLLMRTDKMAMANSVEARVPFLDHRLIEFAMSAPEGFKLRDRVNKEPVKRLLAKRLKGMAQEIYRRKRGFGAPVMEWFQGALKKEYVALLDDQKTEAGRFFNTTRLKEDARRGPSSVNQGFQMWVIYNFLNWRKLVLGGQSGLAK